MYEQFLAANSQKQQQHDHLQHHIGNTGGGAAGHQNISNIIGGESQEGIEDGMGDNMEDDEEEGGQEEEEIDYDNIDYD
jgi:hypothetical protein